MILFKILLKKYRFLAKLKTKFFYRFILKKVGKKSIIFKPLKIIGPQNILIGNNVEILESAWLSSTPLTGSCNSLLEIKDGTSVGHYCHIYSTKKIIIEEKVLLADKVYISDNSHTFDKINVPVIDQKIKQLNSVNIGAGSWIGENVCIIGAKIGKQCIIGANSVVLSDIPDYSIAVGSPAKVIKKYDFKIKKWEKV